MRQHFAEGMAVGAVGDHLSGVDSPSWGIRLAPLLDEPGIRSVAQSLAAELGTQIEWDLLDDASFSSALWSGAICSPAFWSFEWLDRYEVQSLLALLSGGVSLLPSMDGSRFEFVNKPAAVRRLSHFLERLRRFVAHSELHPIELSFLSKEGRQQPEGDTMLGWQFVFDQLSREQADQVSNALRGLIDVEAIDPREHYLLLGDRGTAQSILAMASDEDSSLPNWDDEGFVTVAADEIRTTLEGFMADDLALFLEMGYVYGVELAEPLTEIPVRDPKSRRPES